MQGRIHSIFRKCDITAATHNIEVVRKMLLQGEFCMTKSICNDSSQLQKIPRYSDEETTTQSSLG